jgi:hypothetical protein
MVLRGTPARGLLSVVLLLAPALTVVEACGGSKASPGVSADGSAPKDAASSTDDAAIPGPGMATLSGPQAFPVGSATMGVSLSGGCGGSAAADSGVIPTVSILLTSQGLPELLCSDAGFPDGGTGYWLDIELATTQAAVGDSEVLTQSIVPGSYVVGDEGENDPDPCMLPAGSNAFIQLLTPTGVDAQGMAITGTVTIDSVSAGAVTGTFSVLMGDPYGRTDAMPPPTLSGAFNALACP